MKNKIIIVFILLLNMVTFAQQKITWKDLAKVEYTDKFFPAYGETFLFPEFSDAIVATEGELVSITGYFLNVDPRGKLFILSKGPMSSCFFCGVGGPETAIELQFKTKPNIKTDTVVTITGKLKLNKMDIEHFNYILTDCKVILKQ